MGRLRRGRDRLLPKTVDNVLTVLSTLLKKAVEWPVSSKSRPLRAWLDPLMTVLVGSIVRVVQADVS